jgi:hypothetical protein
MVIFARVEELILKPDNQMGSNRLEPLGPRCSMIA